MKSKTKKNIKKRNERTERKMKKKYHIDSTDPERKSDYTYDLE